MWLSNSVSHARIKRRMQKAANWMKHSLVNKPFQTWFANVQERKRLTKTATKVVTRWNQLTISIPFFSWVSSLQEEKRLRTIACKVVTRWNQLTISIPFFSWVSSLQEEKRLRTVACKVVTRWNQLTISIPFFSWVSSLQEEKRLRTVACKVVTRWNKLAIWVPLFSWHHHVILQNMLVKAAKKVVHRWTQLNTSRAFLAWQDYVRERAIEACEAEHDSVLQLLQEQHNEAHEKQSLIMHGLEEEFSLHKMESSERIAELSERFSAELHQKEEAQETIQTLSRKVEEHEKERQILREDHAAEKSTLESRVSREKERRLEMARRVVLRYQKCEVMRAFELFETAVQRHKAHSEMMLNILDTLLNEGNLNAIGLVSNVLQAGPNNCEK